MSFSTALENSTVFPSSLPGCRLVSRTWFRPTFWPTIALRHTSAISRGLKYSINAPEFSIVLKVLMGRIQGPRRPPSHILTDESCYRVGQGLDRSWSVWQAGTSQTGWNILRSMLRPSAKVEGVVCARYVALFKFVKQKKQPFFLRFTALPFRKPYYKRNDKTYVLQRPCAFMGMTLATKQKSEEHVTSDGSSACSGLWMKFLVSAAPVFIVVTLISINFIPNTRVLQTRHD